MIMKEQDELLLERAFLQSQEIEKKVKRSLAGKSFSLEDLAEQLSFYLPDLKKEEIIRDLKLLSRGLATGHRAFEDLYERSPEDMNEEIKKKLEQRLATLSEHQKRQSLMLLCQSLYQGSGIRIGDNLAVYLANMPTEELMKEACFLLHEKGKEMAGDYVSLLMGELEKREHTQNVGAPLNQQRFSEEEENLLEAAAIYAGFQKVGLKLITPEQMGKEMGVQKSFLKRFSETLHDVIIPIMLKVLAIGAVAISIYCLAEVLLYSEAIAFITAYISEHHMWRIAIPAVLSVVATIGSWFSENIFCAPVIHRCKSMAEEAKNTLSYHLQEREREADRFMETVSSEYLIEEEESVTDCEDEEDIEWTPQIDV